MSKNEKRLFRALAREGLSVTQDGSVYTVRLSNSDSSSPSAEILLPSSLPLESKAVKQICELAAVRHPNGSHVCRACASPDFHPGDAGVAIGSVVETDDIVIPQAVGGDICCGMRLHTTNLTVDRFLSQKAAFVEKLKGDYLLGTRDVAMSPGSMREMFTGGLGPWSRSVRSNPLGRMGSVDWGQVEAETLNVYQQGAMNGHWSLAPESLVPDNGIIRDEGLATIGRGNHFCEVLTVESVTDKKLAYQWGVKAGQVAFMIHTGSRNVGRYVGSIWEERARKAWPAGVKYPESGLFPIQGDLIEEYVKQESTAANYGFVNRALLAELCRLRLREVFGDVEAPLVYDLPHNITLRENGKWVSRKGACPAHEGQPVIIPGSMGTSSFLCVGLGNDRFISSASHGAGRAQSRGSMGRTVRDAKHAQELGLTGVDCITLREERRIEEAPNAYKPIQPIIDAQVEAGTIRVVARMAPLLTFKA